MSGKDARRKTGFVQRVLITYARAVNVALLGNGYWGN